MGQILFPCLHSNAIAYQRESLGTQIPNVPQVKKTTVAVFVFDGSGTPEGTRTPDLLIRSQSLYPTELLAHAHALANVPEYNNTSHKKMQALFSLFFVFFAFRGGNDA